MLTIIVVLIAFVLGVVMPIRWGVMGYIGFSLLLFTVLAILKMSDVFGGSSFENTLALFNDSWVSYIGFNVKLAYRAFASVLLAFSVPLIFRLSRAARPESK